MAGNEATPDKWDDNAFELAWPVEEGKAAGLYFYLEPIEEYLPGNRVRVTGHGEMLLLGGYSYLGLNNHPAINAAASAAIEKYGTGTHGVRLLAGTLAIHRDLEAEVARFKNTEAAATFSSGYFANVCTIACLVGRHDTVICDKLDHASIVDGCLLSGAKFVRYRHNDMEHLEKSLKDSKNSGRIMVVSDGVFSMDGDVLNLPEISRLCRKYGALLMVDEAQSLGVLGKTGRGVECVFRRKPITRTARSRSLIPRQADHPFRSKPITIPPTSRSLWGSRAESREA